MRQDVIDKLRKGMPPGYISIPWDAVQALETEITLYGGAWPAEVVELHRRYAAEVENLRRLTIMFQGIVDQGAIDRCVTIRRQIDDAWGRASLIAGGYIDGPLDMAPRL